MVKGLDLHFADLSVCCVTETLHFVLLVFLLHEENGHMILDRTIGLRRPAQRPGAWKLERAAWV